MKKLLIMSLACLLALLPGLSLAEDMTKEEAYTEYVELLDLYMLADEESPVDIKKLIEGFEGLRTYKYSIQFLIYARVMDFIAQEDYQQAGVWLDVLVLYPEFSEMLKAEDYPYTAIRSLDEMRLYYEGRVAQAQGDLTGAAEKYQHCLTFYDSMTRFTTLGASLDGMFAETLQLLANGEYQQVLVNTEFLLKYGYTQAQPIHDMAKQQLSAQAESEIVPIEVQTMSLTGGYNGTSAVMSWNEVSGADSYRLYRSRGRQGEMMLIVEQQKAGYYDRGCYEGIYNGYIVEALQGGVVIARSQQTNVFCEAEKKNEDTHLTIGNGSVSTDSVGAGSTGTGGSGLTIGQYETATPTIGNGSSSGSGLTIDQYETATPTIGNGSSSGSGLTIDQYETATPTIGNGNSSGSGLTIGQYETATPTIGNGSSSDDDWLDDFDWGFE